MSSPLDMIAATCAGATKPERVTAAEAFAACVAKTGVAASFSQFKLNETLATNFKKAGKAGANTREGSMFCITELISKAPVAATFFIEILPQLIDLQGDKLRPVALACKDAFDAVFPLVKENVAMVLPQLLKASYSVKGNLCRLECLSALCEANPPQVASMMSEAVIAVVPFIHNISKPIEAAAAKCLHDLCLTCDNPDMVPFFPSLEACMADPKKIPETVFDMASSVFVAEVEGSTMSLLAPVLTKGLATTSPTAVKRQCARIIENMCKLVEEPRFVSGLLTKVLPLLNQAKASVSDPECRDVCEKAASALDAKGAQAAPLTFDIVLSTSTIKEVTGETKAEFDFVYSTTASTATMLNEVNDLAPANWEKAVLPFLTQSGAMKEPAAKALITKLVEVAELSRVVKEEAEVDDDAEVLCDLEFGLAFGNKVLLRKTKLKLLRGHHYGLLGQNDSGKTSLLTAIADYKIEGFPSAEEMRCVFVATDIKTELADLSVIDYMFNDPLLKNCGATKEMMAAKLESVGFREGAPANITQTVGTLSGGWRMKLALSRAMLLNADILLLDEPTNHLDTYNVKWVEAYLQSLTGVTCIMVSHDSGLLTRVCTDMIEIDQMKLKYFRGNLEKLVAARPECKAYFELADQGKYDFSFPSPGPLPGVKSKGKAILQMKNITFTYPGAKKAQLNNVTVQVSLSSRVACVGENGAGKSTMIKLLTGELEPDAGSGKVDKHPNARVGYIAQHAFHHIEHHLDVSANDYIRWRYANGGDREELVKSTMIATPEEIKLMETPFELLFPQEDGTVLKRKVVIERFTERRRDVKNPKGYEYEVTYKGSTQMNWISRKNCVKQGWEKHLKGLDERIALRATQFARPLTKENVQAHLAAVGLAPEFSTHMRIGSLSGGQKVKVVLASALWSQPHILILDEPTNYLDRESLGALARAIRKFDGGVVMITHNSQFCDNLCPVVWHLQNNTLDVKGDAEWMAEAAKAAIVVHKIDESDMVDKFGNTIVLKKKKEYTKKQLKAKAKRRMMRVKAGDDDFDSDEDEESD